MIFFLFYILDLILSVLKTSIDELLDAVREKNQENALKWSTTPEWLTVGHFLDMDTGNFVF